MAGLTKDQRAAKALLERAVVLSGLSADEFATLGEEEQGAWSAKANEALEQEAEQAAKSKQFGSKDDPDHSGLIKVRLGPDEIYVHPTCLADHKRLGWEEA